MLILLKLLFIASVVGTLWASPRYRHMSRQLDEATLSSIRRMMWAAEESGFPPEIVPLLIGLLALSFATSAIATTLFGR
jgi:hypothetical protein